jgi:hypothetical protein
MGIALEDTPLNLQEIAAVMCAVAIGNDVKMGKRGFKKVTRDLFGLQLEVRFKSPSIALVGKSWRCRLKIGQLNTGKTSCKVPYLRYGHRREGKMLATVVDVFPFWVEEVKVEIDDQNRFERDWTLLRLFSSEWEEYRN